MPESATVIAGLYDVVFDVYGRTLLAGVNLDVHADEMVVLTGEPGSGKTLLLQILAGITAPTVGEAVFRGEAIDFERPRNLPIAYLPQTSCLDERLLAWQWLEYVGACSGITPEVCGQFDPLGRLGLRDLHDTRIVDLSPLQQRLLDFAALIMTRPALYVLDSLFTGMSDSPRSRIVAYLREEISRSVGVIIAATNESELPEMGARVLVLEHGRVREVRA